jgi:hypothetical protein
VTGPLWLIALNPNLPPDYQKITLSAIAIAADNTAIAGGVRNQGCRFAATSLCSQCTTGFFTAGERHMVKSQAISTLAKKP